MHHIFLPMHWGSHPPHILKLLTFLRLGRASVDMFIVLSGFCLMLPVTNGNGFLKGSTASFFKRRARRILPTYYCALALSIIAGCTFISQKTDTLWSHSLPVDFKSILTHVFLMHDVLGDNHKINYVLWSIAVEWRIYFLFPVLLFLWRKFSPFAVTLTSVVISSILYCVLVNYVSEGLTIHYIGLFCMGMLGTTIAFSSAGTSKWRRFPWGLSIIGLGFALIFLNSDKLNSVITSEYASLMIKDNLMGLWSMCILMYATKADNVIYRVLNSRPMSWIGTFSYSIYLIHPIILQLVWLTLPSSLKTSPTLFFFSLIFVSVPAVILCSYGFFLLCERPFLRKKVIV